MQRKIFLMIRNDIKRCSLSKKHISWFIIKTSAHTLIDSFTEWNKRIWVKNMFIFWLIESIQSWLFKWVFKFNKKFTKRLKSCFVKYFSEERGIHLSFLLISIGKSDILIAVNSRFDDSSTNQIAFVIIPQKFWKPWDVV
jgi:hypothetical protein